MDVDPDARQGSTPEADVTTEETVVEVERIRERDSEESGAEEDPQTPEVVVMEEVEDSEANTEVEDQTIYEAKEFENRHDREMDIPMEETVEPEPMDVQGDRDEVISASDGAEDVAIIEDVEDASGEGGGRIDGGSDYGGALQEDEPERDELPSRKISENVESEEGKVTTAAVSSGEGTVSMWDEDEDVAGFSSRSARQVRKMRAEEEMIGEFSSSSIRSSSRYEASSSSFSSRLSSSHSTSVRESYSSVEASSSSLSASLAAERRRLELEEVASEAFSTGDYSRSLDARLPVATERRKLIESEESDTRVSGYRKTAEERRQDALSYSSHDEEESVTSKRSADVASLKDEVKVESALKDEEKVRGKTDKEEVVEEAVVEEVKEGSAAEEQEKAAAEETEVFQEVVEKQEEKVEEKEEAVVEKEEKLQEKEDVVVAKEEAAVKAAEGTVTAKKEEKVEGRKAAVADEEVEDVFAGRSDDVAATTAARVPKPSERKKISVSSEQEEVSVSRKISSSREEVSRSESKSSSASREKSQVESRERSLNIPEDRRIPLSKSESKSLVVPDISEGEPKFLKTLRGVHIGPGDTARFDCTLEDRGHNSVTWLRNNHPFEDRLADRVVIREDKNMFSLIIKNCHEEDSGLITARATNASGICSISTAQLIVDENQHPEESPAPEGSEPRFIVSLKDTELVEKTHARFMIKVVGEPKPKLTFLKDGVKLVEDDRVRVLQEGATSYDFEITETLSQDQGRYECIAENVHGMASTTGEVKVTAEKDIWKSVKSIDKILAPGEEPEFEWFRDGERFEPEERFKVLLKDDEDTLALIFKHVRPEDAGLYTCVASTSCGKMSCSAELTVQGAVHHLLREPVPPEILLHLTDTEVSTGGSAMLELKVTGYPKPDCSWYKDGQLITAGGRYRFLYEDDTSIALIIKNVEKGDGGKYVVKAKNEIGEAETSGNLIVRAPPRFKKKTSDVACMTDAPMKYNVEVEGNPAPEIKWYKDGQLIMESERVKVVKESDESFTLLIQRVMLEDSGSYSIVASNEIGQMSDFFQLTANSPPQFHRRLKKLVEAREEDDIEFEVDVRGNPAPKIKWFHKDKELTESGNVAFSKKGDSIHVLKIKGISRKDMGKITCRVSNEHGEDEDTSQLKVFCKPEVQKPLTDMTVKEGDKVDLECGIEAYPEPKITWYHEETEITEVKKEYTKLSKEGIYNLIMEEIQEEMAGKYLIQAWNDLGKAESSGNVNVKFRPKVITSLENCERDETQEAVFTVRAKGNPAPSAEWFDNKGKKIAPSDHYKIEEDGDSYTLRIPDTTGADSGEYSVILTNEIDILEIKATLLVNKPKERSDKRTSDEERKEKEVTKQQEKKKEVKEELSEEESSESSDESTEEFVSPPPIKRVIPEKKREDSFPRDEAAAEQEVPKKKVFDDEKDEDWPPRDEAPAEQEVPKKKVFDDEKGEDWPPRDEAAAEQEVPKKKVFDDEKDENWPPRDEAAAEQEVPKNKVFDDEKDEDWPPRDEEVVEQEVPKKKVFDDEKDEDWPPRDEAAAEQEVPKKKVFDDEKDEDWPPRDEVAAEQEVPKKKVFDDEKNEDWPPRDEAAAEQEVPKEKAFDDEKDEEWLPRDEAAVEKEVPKKTFFGDEKDEGWLSRNGEKEVPKKKAFGDEKGEGWPIDDEAVTEKPEVEDRKPQPKAKASQEEVPVPEVNEELPAKKVGGVDQTKPSQPVEEKPSSLSAEENADEKTVGEAVKEVIGKTVKEKASDEKKKEEVVETPKKKDSMENKKPPPSQQPAKVPEDVKDKKAKEEPTVAPAKAEVKKQEIKKETSRSSEECKTIALTKPACDLEFDKINTTLTAVVPAKTSEDNKGQFLDPNVEASNCSRKRFVPQLLSGEEDFAAIEETVETFTLVDEDGVEAEPFYECEGDGLVHHVDIGDICSTFDPCDLLMEDVSSPTVIIPREDASWLEKEIRSRSHLSSFVRLQSVDIESLDLHDPGTSQVRDEGAFVIEEKVTKMKVTRMKRNNDLIEVIKNDSAVECDDSSESIEGLEDFVELSDVFLESVSPQEVEFPVEIIPLDEVFSAEKRTRTKSGAMKKVHFEGLSDVQIKDLDEAPLNTPHDAGELERKPNSAVSTLVSSEGYEQIQTMAVNDHVLSLKDIARKVGSSVVSSEALETSMIASVETDNAKVSVATEKVTAPSTTSPSCETETMKSLTETNMIQSEEMTQISASIQTQNATSSVTSFKAEKTVSSVTSFETERERTFETSTESCKTTLSETEKVSASVISLETQRDVTSLETDKAAYSYEKASISSVETGERALSAVTSGVTVSETAHVASLEGNATISTYSFETEKASISSVETEERALSAVTSGVTVSETANVASLEDQTKLGNATLSAAPFETEKAASVVTSCETDKALLSVSEEDKGASVIAVHEVGRRISEDIPGSVEYPSEVCLQGMPSTKEDLDAICDEKPVKEQEELPIPVEDVLCPEQVEFDVHGSEGTSNIEETSSYGSEEHSFDFEESVEKAKDSSDKINIDKMEIESLDEVCAVKLDEIDLPEDPSFVKVEEEELVEEALSHDDISDHTLERASSSETVVSENLAELGSSLDIDERSSRDSVDLTAEPELEEVEPEMFSVLDPQNAKIITEVDTKVVPVCEEPLTVSTKEVEGLAANASVEVTQEITSVVDFGINKGVRFEPAVAHAVEIHLPHLSPESPFSSEEFSEFASPLSQSLPVELRPSVQEGLSSATTSASPKILGGQINCDAIETDDYVLEFKGSGVPNPKVVWTKNGEEVKDTDRIKAVQEDDTFKLILNNIQMEDDGEYECLLENRLGSESIKGVVKVTKIDEVLHPKIKPWLENQVIIEDDCGTLSCKVYGSPAPEITWFKDDQEIENSDHIRAYSEHDDPREKRLKLNVVKEQDMGQYKIVARNVHGEVDSEAHVEITWKPKIKGLRHLDKVTVDYGDDVSIAATVSANPKSDVVWKHNGVELPKGDAVRGYEEDGDTYTLVIKAADYRRDDGKYTLHARNELGETVDGFELEVHTIKPYFKLALENASAPLGAPLTLLARIDGLPKPTATWYKEGVEVTESTPGITLNFEEGFHELKIERIEEAFLCKYTIVGTSDVGECTSSGEVTCDTHPPLIEGQLRKVNRLHEGDTLTLEAVAKGSPIPVITWYKDGVPIEPDGERIVATSQPDGTQVLVVKNVTPDDEGEYKLAARNKFGEVSSPSHVEVKGAPDKPHFVKELGDVTAVLGMPVDLVAQVSLLNAGINLSGKDKFKDGKPIHGGFLNDPDGTTTFHISWPKVEDVGTYSIVATNDSGEAESVGTLKLEGAAGPPKILAPMKNARAVEGYPVKLETTVSGHPLPEIVWMKGDDIIEPDGVRVRAVVEPNGTVALIIDEAQLKDTGDYTLIAKNPQGEDKRRVKLVVLDKFKDGEAEAEPYFKTPLKDVTIPEGSELRLIADIIGNPLPDVVWKRNGEPIEKGGDVKVAFDGKKVSVREVQLQSEVWQIYRECFLTTTQVGLIAPCVRRADAGEFECCLKNPLGEAKSSCQVSIEKTYEAPTWTQKFSDQQQVCGSLIVSTSLLKHL
ncbi:unnamed protein product [Cyprideis torosa]|uniref:Uncharacterized protein n=1 Tax=Cyprideis torosa TaxID=163714 RepID=A0A7R8ZJD1_9CRUS|nr:unnamed protein product [Cyprideis torosa]CAG0879560.1 unnamed protein product [Cyprideis torosa]